MQIPFLKNPYKTRGVTALLGPTNTGKTHFAIERMLGHKSGMIGLPLRLLAREVYQRVVDKVGVDAVALITGEEKIKPADPRYWVSTVEAMPRDLDVSFVAIDEVQLAADPDRGHVFTDAMLNRRGTEETVLIGSSTIRSLIEELLPDANIITRPRLSKLTFSGERKITRLPPRSAIVAFSAEEVYAIAELIRRQRGGAAVVLGALSPRTRNAQVALFQSGEVEHIVATDAIGMGLNLEVDHVAFAANRKFDGVNHRLLHAAEMGQIAGRAGRHLKDGTFGTTGRCPEMDEDMVEALENHRFDPVRLVNWRNPDLSFKTLASLRDSLAVTPTVPGIIRARMAEDEQTLDILAARPHIQDIARGRDGVFRLWEICQLPDYRKATPQIHADLIQSLYDPLMRRGHVPDDWFSREIAQCDRVDGDIATLSARIAHIRTWTFCANRADWLRDPVHWQNVSRAIEDKLSDALHEKLAQRFIDRRTSVLMRRLRENTMLEAEVTDNGDVLVESHHLGRLEGFRFTPDNKAEGSDAKALRAAATKVLASEIEQRARKLSDAGDDSFVLSLDGTLRWIGAPVARLSASERILDPRLVVLADEHLTGIARDQVEARVALWLRTHVQKLLGPLLALEEGSGLSGAGRGVGYQVAENLGVLDRSKVAEIVKTLGQEERGELRAHGVRFGAYHVYTAGLLKPAPRALAAQLWALKFAPEANVSDVSHLASSGRTSIPVDQNIGKDLYRVAGFRVCGERAVRVDILERLADLIRPALAWRAGALHIPAPEGAFEGGGFTVTGAMTSLVGCAGDDFAAILTSLGYRKEMKPLPPKKVEVVEAGQSPAADQPEEVSAQASAPGGEGVAETVEVSTQSVAAELPVADPVVEATEVLVTEPVLVAVWRPGRLDHERPRHARPQRGNDRSRQGQGAGRGSETAPAGAGDGAAQERQAEHPNQDRRPREDRRPRDDRKPRDNRGERGEGRRPENKRFEGGRPARDNKAGSGQERHRMERPSPAPRPEKPMDPDSPFAKLLALKAMMDKPKG